MNNRLIYHPLGNSSSSSSKSSGSSKSSSSSGLPGMDGDECCSCFMQLLHQLDGLLHRVQQTDLDEHRDGDALKEKTRRRRRWMMRMMTIVCMCAY